MEFKSSSSSCRNEDNSTNITVSCTLSCGRPFVKIFGINIYPGFHNDTTEFRLYDIYRYTASGETVTFLPCSNVNNDDNITVIVNGAISGVKRVNEHKCSYMLECLNHEGDAYRAESFTYEDCSITGGNCGTLQSSSPTVCSPTTLIETTTVQSSPTVTTMDCSNSEEMDPSVTNMYTWLCPDMCTEVTTTVTASASGIIIIHNNSFDYQLSLHGNACMNYF